VASVAVYGGYTHTDNEVNLVSVQRRKNFSPRHKALTETRTVNLRGELIYSTSQSIITTATNVMNAYSQDYRDFTYTVGGVVVEQLRNTGDCLSGVQVVNKTFPAGGPEQFATTRTFGVTLQATYDTCEDDTVSWRESIEVTGTGGPLWVVVQGVAGVQTLGGPFAYFLAPATAQYYHQYGEAVGFTNYPVPPPPINSAWEFGFRRRITNTSGVNQGKQIKFYKTSWSYYMATDPRIGVFSNTPTSK